MLARSFDHCHVCSHSGAIRFTTDFNHSRHPGAERSSGNQYHSRDHGGDYWRNHGVNNSRDDGGNF